MLLLLPEIVVLFQTLPQTEDDDDDEEEDEDEGGRGRM